LAVKKINTDELGTRSAALSYYFILALFPMLLFNSLACQPGWETP